MHAVTARVFVQEDVWRVQEVAVVVQGEPVIVPFVTAIAETVPSVIVVVMMMAESARRRE
jgi:hypothetical protein